MTAAALFAAYAATAGILAPSVLRLSWVTRTPRLAMALWLALPASWVAAVMLAILTATGALPLTWPRSPRDEARVLLAGHALPGGRAVAIAGLLAACAVALWTARCAALEFYRGRRLLREHAARVTATARPGYEPGVAILGQDSRALYCLPAGRYPIVISAGALTVLTPQQLRAVLAHERAHLRQRHHAILTLATALARAFPQVPLLAQARPQLGQLAEMAADDAAARGHRRNDLAAALVVLASTGTSPVTLSAGGPAAIGRLQRLLTPDRPRTRIVSLFAGAGLIPPLAIAVLPLLLAACDIASHS